MTHQGHRVRVQSQKPPRGRWLINGRDGPEGARSQTEPVEPGLLKVDGRTADELVVAW